jgi:hypothetical protein
LIDPGSVEFLGRECRVGRCEAIPGGMASVFSVILSYVLDAVEKQLN